jgi:hypothetical protein
MVMANFSMSSCLNMIIGCFHQSIHRHYCLNCYQILGQGPGSMHLHLLLTTPTLHLSCFPFLG